jgi:predicted NBD/HSP70 family sugar kinase
MKQPEYRQHDWLCYGAQMRITDQQRNRLTVLKAIRREGAVARRELPGLTGLSAGTITQLTGDLVRRALVTETREDGKRNGRPRALLAINPEGSLVVAASLMGAGLLHIALVDLAGQRRFNREIRIGEQSTLSHMAEAIGRAIDDAIMTAPVQRERIVRAAIALPALVDSVRGTVHFMTTFPPGPPVPFAEPIAERLGIPVTVENEMICMARSEHWFGRAQALDDFSLVYVGFNIGAAEYVGGLPRIAANGLNQELGHAKFGGAEGARRCYCGGLGCLTASASMYGLLEAVDLHRNLPFPPLHGLPRRFEEFMDIVDGGNAAAAEAITQAGDGIGTALATLVSATNSSALLVAVANARLLERLRGPIEAALDRNLMPSVRAMTPVSLMLGDADWRWRGTAALALEQTFIGQG